MHYEIHYAGLSLLVTLFVILIGLTWGRVQYHRYITRIYPPRGQESRAEAERLLAQKRSGLAIRCLRVAEGLSFMEAHAEIEAMRTGVKPQLKERGLVSLAIELAAELCMICLGLYGVTRASEGSWVPTLAGGVLILVSLLNLMECVKKIRRRMTS